ncbi:hypothetical protein N7519_001542 [Penicillium mononematosum]|uniref:uncharacterized protein n=1 Tax=Penicillium mononematosum TaxID=268346 RepID=UPI002546EA27|nr:uncharacterized protein N7519_001542 [Penicillium mononematosum]KAJ6191521.1 hypothetical protein N7519_001542 [Penicillium mononematosum]
MSIMEFTTRNRTFLVEKYLIHYLANRHKVADPRPILVIGNYQLEELADLQSRAIQREVAREESRSPWRVLLLISKLQCQVSRTLALSSRAGGDGGAVSGYDCYVVSMGRGGRLAIRWGASPLERQANKWKVAEPRPIPVPSNAQLEELAHLQYRALQRDAERRRVHGFVDRALADLEAAMVGILDSGLLTRWMGRWERLRAQRLRRIDDEEEEDAQVLQQIWSQIV